MLKDILFELLLDESNFLFECFGGVLAVLVVVGDQSSHGLVGVIVGQLTFLSLVEFVIGHLNKLIDSFGCFQ